MAKTVDNFATIEDFRKQYNELAYDVGEIDGLNDALKLGSNDTIVDAINVLDNKQFFLQEFNYIATLNQTTFTGLDSFDKRLSIIDLKTGSQPMHSYNNKYVIIFNGENLPFFT